MAVIFSSLLGDTIFASIIFFVLYYLATRNINYWEKRGVRSIRSWPFFGSLPTVVLLRDNIATALHKKYEQMAKEPFFGITFMGVPALVVNDLNLVKSVLVKDANTFLNRTFSIQEEDNPLWAKNLFSLGGKKWRHLRAKLTPTFTSGKMRKMFHLVDECGKHLANCLAKEASSGGIVDVKDLMARYTTDAIASCAFGVDANALADSESEFRSVMKKVFKRNSFFKKIVGNLAFIVPAVAKLFKMKIMDDEINDYVRRMFWNVVDDRKKTGMFRNDFVDLMIKLKDEGEVKIKDTKDLQENEQESLRPSAGHSKTDITDIKLEGDDFVAQAFVFLIGGFDTSSSALNFTLYELAHELSVQEKLRNEITRVLDKHGGDVTYDVIADMSYLDMVVSESLRKYPPAGFLERMCASDFKLPGYNVVVEKGTTVMISVLGIHHDPNIYPDPEKFNPERFSSQNKTKIPHCAFIPFGEGPRICIGMRFALMQVKTALVHILTSHEVHVSAQTPRPPLTFKAESVGQECRENIVLEFKKL